MEDIKETVMDAYNRGYKHGQIDGISQIRNSTQEFIEQISKTLIEAVEDSIKEKKGDK